MLKGFLLLLFLASALVSNLHAQVLDDVTDQKVTIVSSRSDVVGKRFTFRAFSQPVLNSFTGLVVEIESPAEQIDGSVRFEKDGVWSDWVELYSVRSATEDLFVSGFHSDVVRTGVRFEIKLTNDSASTILVRNVGVFDNRTDADGSEDDSRQTPETGLVGKIYGKIVPPALITRAEWGASPFRGSPVDLARPTMEFITFHHAAGFSATTKDEGIRQVKAIQDLHQNVRGWSDIGYQFAIDRGGRLYQGRPFMDGSTSLAQVPVLALGAHVGGHNTGNIGVVLLGCYHPPEGSYCEQVPTPEALETFRVLFAFLSERYDVSPTLIRGHRDFSPTACPGNNNYSRLPKLRSDVATLVLTGNQPLGVATLSGSVDTQGIVRLDWEFLDDFGIDNIRIERSMNDATEIVYSGSGAENGSTIDENVNAAGQPVYSLYVGAGDGREQRLATLELSVDVPEQFILAGAYPNPVQSSTRLRYFVARDGVVRLNVFDAAGRRVRALVDGFQKSDRWYSIDLDVSTLPGGIYYYRLQIQGFSGLAFEKTRSFAVVR